MTLVRNCVASVNAERQVCASPSAYAARHNIQATSTLNSSNWTTLTNITLQSDPYIYVDYNSWTNNQQFYRVVP